jgi:hypothetical protein
MAEPVHWKKPRRLNAVSGTLLVLVIVGAYWFWRFFPAYFDAWTVDHILKETAAAIYRANRLREPERSTTLKELVDKAVADIRKRASVTDPDLQVDMEIQDDHASVTADYHVVVTHPSISKTTTLHFTRRADANIKTVRWD